MTLARSKEPEKETDRVNLVGEVLETLKLFLLDFVVVGWGDKKWGRRTSNDPRCFTWIHWMDKEAVHQGRKKEENQDMRGDKFNLEFIKFGDPIEYPNIDYQ